MLTIDFAAIRAGKTTFNAQTNDIHHGDLRRETKEIFETIQSITADATDADVLFVPNDPQATEGEQGWTLSHVLVHLTASLEEMAAVAALLSRGFIIEQRLHTETPWETVTTVAQVRARLNECRRICNAYLEAWPDSPNLETNSIRIPSMGPMNAISVCALGILHFGMHVEQLKEVMRQAKEARK